MWQYNNTDELYHYGVLGMKWGHRKNYIQAIRTARKARRDRDNKIRDRVWKEEAEIEKGYKRGQMLSKKDQQRENAADDRAMKGWAASKAQYKKDKQIAKATYKSKMKNLKNKSDKQSSNKKSKKMSIKKKIAIGAAVTASVIAGAYVHKKFKDYKVELDRDNKKYSEYKKKVREIINNKRALDDKWEKEVYNIYTHPNPLTGELRGVPVARRVSRRYKSQHLGDALREIEDLNKKTFSDNRKDMRKEISNFMGETNRKKAVDNLSNIKNKASENIKLLRKRRK